MWLRVTKKNEINTVHTAMKNLKTYVNMAKRKGVIEACPFDHYHVAKQKSGRLFLTESELESLWALYLREFLTQSDQLVLRHFLFMCLTGLRISDFKAIGRKNLIENVLEYTPVKTAKTTTEKIRCPLNSYARKLIVDEQSKIDALFNPISEGKMNPKYTNDGLHLTGEGFLKQQIRNMVGTLLEVGQGRRELKSIQELLRHPQKLGGREASGFCAPAEGLYLIQVQYGG